MSSDVVVVVVAPLSDHSQRSGTWALPIKWKHSSWRGHSSLKHWAFPGHSKPPSRGWPRPRNRPSIRIHKPQRGPPWKPVPRPWRGTTQTLQRCEVHWVKTPLSSLLNTVPAGSSRHTRACLQQTHRLGGGPTSHMSLKTRECQPN